MRGLCAGDQQGCGLRSGSRLLPWTALTCALYQGLSQLPLLFPELSQVPPDLFLLLLQPLLLLCVPLHLGFCPVLAKFDLCKPGEGNPLGQPGWKTRPVPCPQPTLHTPRGNQGLSQEVRAGHQAGKQGQ